jgi:hypothetical protein
MPSSNDAPTKVVELALNWRDEYNAEVELVQNERHILIGWMIFEPAHLEGEWQVGDRWKLYNKEDVQIGQATSPEHGLTIFQSIDISGHQSRGDLPVEHVKDNTDADIIKILVDQNTALQDALKACIAQGTVISSQAKWIDAYWGAKKLLRRLAL